MRRPDSCLSELLPESAGFDPAAQEQAQIQIKYEGYLKKEAAHLKQTAAMEGQKLPVDLDYPAISGLRIEARQKLDRLKPLSLGQASRIPGVSPADIAVLQVWLKKLQASASPQG